MCVVVAGEQFWWGSALTRYFRQRCSPNGERASIATAKQRRAEQSRAEQSRITKRSPEARPKLEYIIRAISATLEQLFPPRKSHREARLLCVVVAGERFWWGSPRTRYFRQTSVKIATEQQLGQQSRATQSRAEQRRAAQSRAEQRRAEQSSAKQSSAEQSRVAQPSIRERSLVLQSAV